MHNKLNELNVEATGGFQWEKVFLEILQNWQENICARNYFLIKFYALACNSIKKEIPVQVFSCEFCEISNNIFFTEHLQATASQLVFLKHFYLLIFNLLHSRIVLTLAKVKACFYYNNKETSKIVNFINSLKKL